MELPKEWAEKQTLLLLANMLYMEHSRKWKKDKYPHQSSVFLFPSKTHLNHADTVSFFFWMNRTNFLSLFGFFFIKTLINFFLFQFMQVRNAKCTPAVEFHVSFCHFEAVDGNLMGMSLSETDGCHIWNLVRRIWFLFQLIVIAIW